MAFAKDQDVHSVSTEILYPEKWPTLRATSIKDKKTGLMVPYECEYYKQAKETYILPNGQVINAGDLLRKKCKCPGHNELRNGTKATNFLLCYGGGPDALADGIGCSLEEAKKLMQLHESKFPDVWKYLERSGEDAKRLGEARDLFGRRRLFLEPTVETATAWFEEFEEKKLELPELQQEENIFNFKAKELREPNEEETWLLTHRHPNPSEVRQAMRAMMGSIGRRGKNHCIQGSNASIIKRSLGCGFDAQGKPYLWHTLPQYKAELLNMVHDELVLQCPKRYANEVAHLVADAFKRAAGEVMHQVIMEAEWHIADRWQK
jgi:DNA polymerase I-like protein with 3'-5' exonuclease and polymerase domains